MAGLHAMIHFPHMAVDTQALLTFLAARLHSMEGSKHMSATITVSDRPCPGCVADQRREDGLTPEWLAELSRFSNANGKLSIFTGTLVRVASINECPVYSLMDHADNDLTFKVYPSLYMMAGDWRLRFLSVGEDEGGRFIRVEPLTP